MSNSTKTIGVRFTPEEKIEIEAMCEDAGIPPATLAKKCLLSALDYYKQEGHVPMPPVIMPAGSPEYKDWLTLKSGRIPGISEETA